MRVFSRSKEKNQKGIVPIRIVLLHTQAYIVGLKVFGLPRPWSWRMMSNCCHDELKSVFELALRNLGLGVISSFGREKWMQSTPGWATESEPRISVD